MAESGGEIKKVRKDHMVTGDSIKKPVQYIPVCFLGDPNPDLRRKDGI